MKKIMYTFSFDEINKLYWSFADSVSQKLFWSYLMANVEYNFGPFLINIADIRELRINDFPELLRRNFPIQTDRVVICGTFQYAKPTLHILQNLGIEIEGFCEFNPDRLAFCNGSYCNHKIIKVNELREYSDCKAIVSMFAHNLNHWTSLLLEANFPHDNIYPIIEVFSPQYFSSGIMKPEPEEIFVDAGAFDGWTSLQFIDWCNGNYKKIYSFEPSEDNVLLCRENLANIRDVEIVNAGLWNKSDVLRFKERARGSMIDKDSGIEVKVVSLDEYLNGNPATLIKMDIEGAELKALQGARETIKQYKPKLAISIYHKPEDSLEIPTYIRRLNPDYRLYIRPYSTWHGEVVLHAI